MAARAPRGTYAKGAAKREEIILQAIELFGQTGYYATSMREIATACNLSQAGLLHHFPNKEALLMAIVDHREQSQLGDSNPEEAVYEETLVEHTMERARLNQENEALTRLWAILVGEATDTDHPAHEYFKQRNRGTRKRFASVFAREANHATATKEDQLKAAVLTAVWDGLQNQWLIDESFDMLPSFEYALKMLSSYSEKK
jgi:AcrR family transcriptional regulator